MGSGRGGLIGMTLNVLKTTLNCILDYTYHAYATFNVSRSAIRLSVSPSVRSLLSCPHWLNHRISTYTGYIAISDWSTETHR